MSAVAAAAPGSWRDVPVVAVDLEMTGLDPEVDRICEVGVVHGLGGAITQRWSSLVRPRAEMTPGAQAVHGIAPEALDHAPRFEEVAPTLASHLEGRVCVAHRAEVDRRFLEDAFARAGHLVPTCCWVDTLALARGVLCLRSHRLGSLVRSLGVQTDGQHRALADAEAAFGVLNALMGLVDPEGRWSVEELSQAAERLASDSPLREAHLARLQRSRDEGRRAHIVYASRDERGVWRRTERVVEVLSIRRPLVEAHCHLRGEPRLFRLERIHDVQLLAPSDEGDHGTPT